MVTRSKLCLYRGFYLKTGQFLSTRRDFLPQIYCDKLSTLQEEVPPLSADEVSSLLDEELKRPAKTLFSSLNLSHPLGSASIAQVHRGIWRATTMPVAVKVQNPHAERLMTRDLRNIRILAQFLQRTELRFDLLSAVKELQRQIHQEFDFRLEAQNMEFFRKALAERFPSETLVIPETIFVSKRVLVMSLLPGQSLSSLAKLTQSSSSTAPSFWMKFGRRHFFRQVLSLMGEIYGVQLFSLNTFHADPHPGNFLLSFFLNPSSKKHFTLGWVDWGQVKRLSEERASQIAQFVLSLCQYYEAQRGTNLHSSSTKHDNKYVIGNSRKITTAEDDLIRHFLSLGVKVSRPEHTPSICALAISLFDTCALPSNSPYLFSPFGNVESEDEKSKGKVPLMKVNNVVSLPSDLYFLCRSVQLMRGLSSVTSNDDFSVAEVWRESAQRMIQHRK